MIQKLFTISNEYKIKILLTSEIHHDINVILFKILLNLNKINNKENIMYLRFSSTKFKLVWSLDLLILFNINEAIFIESNKKINIIQLYCCIISTIFAFDKIFYLPKIKLQKRVILLFQICQNAIRISGLY